jgi:uncharacterized protein (TIGR03437 family)
LHVAVAAQAVMAALVIEWTPGYRLAWLVAAHPAVDASAELAARLTPVFATPIIAAAEAAGVRYAAAVDGRLWTSFDTSSDLAGWRLAALPAGAGAVTHVVPDPQDGHFALAVASGTHHAGPRVLRTSDGGASWDDLTANLPEASVNGVAYDRDTGAVYVATSAGVYGSYQGLRAPAPSASWYRLGGLPAGAVNDVRLDEPGVRLLAAVQGQGIYETAAPHRTRRPLVLQSADYGQRPAAPGSTLSIVGSGVESITANSLNASEVSSTVEEAQFQLPYDVSGDELRLVAQRAGAAPLVFGLALRAASPAVLIDNDGFPVVIDTDTGVQVDALNPVRPGARLQVLAAGLGRVRPDWPAGQPAPRAHPPEVAAPVRVMLDGAPLKVTRATLAPGYIGYYLVEFEAPAVLNSGLAELRLEAAGESGNTVRVFTAAE